MPVRNVAGGLGENSRTDLLPGPLGALRKRKSDSLACACSFLLRISIKCRSIDDNHKRRTKATLGLEGENASDEERRGAERRGT